MVLLTVVSIIEPDPDDLLGRKDWCCKLYPASSQNNICMTARGAPGNIRSQLVDEGMDLPHYSVAVAEEGNDVVDWHAESFRVSESGSLEIHKMVAPKEHTRTNFRPRIELD